MVEEERRYAEMQLMESEDARSKDTSDGVLENDDTDVEHSDNNYIINNNYNNYQF